MDENRRHSAASVPGAAALGAWAVYLVTAAVFYAPDYPASVWAIGGAGILAGLAVGLNFAYWRAVVILASGVYLVFYAVRVMRMVALTAGFEISSLPSALAAYFQSLWIVTVAMLQEKGVGGSLMHGYIEYAMPLLSLVLIALAWLTRQRPPT